MSGTGLWIIIKNSLESILFDIFNNSGPVHGKAPEVREIEGQETEADDERC